MRGALVQGVQEELLRLHREQLERHEARWHSARTPRRAIPTRDSVLATFK